MNRNNQIEVVKMDEGTVTFDHAGGVMRAEWNNGYTETWRNRCGIEAHRNAFYRFTDQWHRVQEE